MTGGGSPAGGRHCSTRGAPFCTVKASFLSFDHKGDPASWIMISKLPMQYWQTTAPEHKAMKSLTGLPDDDLVGQRRAVLVVRRALVRPLVGLRLLPADVNDKSSRAGLHHDFGVLLHVEMGPVSRPGEAVLGWRREI